ncbi:MAG: hypothetical protein AB1757_00065 [Acidobacteriota bacterium]
MKRAIFIFMIAALITAAACAKKPGEETAPTYKSAEPEVRQDGSTMMVAESETGIKSEVKTFPASSDVAQVTRASWPDGRRSVTIVMRSGLTVDLRDQEDIDRALEMSAEELSAAVKKLGDGVGTMTAPVVAASPSATSQEPEPKPEAKKAENPEPLKVHNENPAKPKDKKAKK